jgi:cytidine deaminase
MALTAQEQAAYAALAAEKVNTGSGYGKTDFWCVACIVSAANAIVRISSCYKAGKSGGGSTPKWFWGVEKANKFSCNDSECKVLNDLEVQGGGAISAVGNRLVTYGYHGPCGSCKRVIAEFRNYYGIPASILYLKDVETVKSDVWPNGTQYGWSDAVREGNLWVGRF